MRLPVKKTQTSIGSWIAVIVLIITLIKCEGQGVVYATYDPLSVANNKFGIHIIQATPGESSPAASLVNSSGGDWGYITFLIESKDRNENKWKEFFNDLRRRHLIPIVRLATKSVNGYWERPYEKEYEAWADFLNNLNWPTKNRYVVIYNEPNHATEWGGSVDAKNYAITLDKTITALKSKNRDFFVLNAGLDASAPQKLPNYQDEVLFLQQMQEAIPGIFEKLDGWVSHSYPNPGFSGSPDAIGRGTVRGWYWEIQQLRNLGVTKNFPIFITEAGWKHAEGLVYDFSLPTAEVVSKYFERAFNGAWNNSNIVVVTPFILSYQEKLFDHFSFKRLDEAGQESGYYSQYHSILEMPKLQGKPIQENKAQLEKGEIFSSIVAGEAYNITLNFKNTGQSIWGDLSSVTLRSIEGGKQLGIKSVEIPKDIKIEPGQQYTFNIALKAPLSGTYKVVLNLFNEEKEFDSNPVEFTTEVKSPVILKIKSMLGWKKAYSGDYILTVKGATGESLHQVNLNSNGISEDLEARYLLPDYSFDFTLEKPFYVPKTLHQKVYTGVNTLDFGIIQPDLFSAILNPKQFWNLLPFSN